MTIRRGICRTVLLVGPWAVKVPSLRANGNGAMGVVWSICRGILANQSERSWTGWEGLCPVRWSLAGLINIYPRCEPVTDYDGDYAEVCTMVPTSMADRKPENLGRLNGRLVWVDYDMSWNGCPHSRMVAEPETADP